jgi:hypothetical protein
MWTIGDGADGTGSSDVDATVVSVTYTEDAVVIHVGRLGAGSRLALAAILLVGGGAAVEAAVVSVQHPRCALTPI